MGIIDEVWGPDEATPSEKSSPSPKRKRSLIDEVWDDEPSVPARSAATPAQQGQPLPSGSPESPFFLTPPKGHDPRLIEATLQLLEQKKAVGEPLDEDMVRLHRQGWGVSSTPPQGPTPAPSPATSPTQEGLGARVKGIASGLMEAVRGMGSPSRAAEAPAPSSTPAAPPLSDQDQALRVANARVSGIKAGLTGLATSTGTLAEIAGRKLGSEALTEWGKIAAEHWDKKGEKYAPAEDIRGSVLDKRELLADSAWWGYNIANMLPSFAAAMLPAVGAYRYINIAGKALRLTPQVIARLAKIGAAVAGGGVGGSLEGTSTYREAIKGGATPEQAMRAGELMTAATAGLNAISLGKMAQGAGAGIRKKIISFLTKGITEGVTEVSEEPAEIIAKRAAGIPVSDEEAREQLRQGVNVFFPAAALGMLGGAAFPTEGTTEAKPKASPPPTATPLPTPSPAVAPADVTEGPITSGLGEATEAPIASPPAEPAAVTPAPGAAIQEGVSQAVGEPEPTEAVPPAELPPAPEDRRKKPYYGPRERREDPARRKAIDAMTPEERADALRYSDKTGLKSLRAYEEDPKKPIQIAMDAHGLKWINDEVSHDAGDALLWAMADAIGEEGYHISGDEMAAQAETEAEGLAHIKEIKETLFNTTFEVTLENGETRRFTGATISVGMGRNLAEALENLNKDKEAAVARGERSADRGGRPGKLVEVSAEQAGEHPGGVASEAVAKKEEVTPAEKFKEVREKKLKAKKKGKKKAPKDIPPDAGVKTATEEPAETPGEVVEEATKAAKEEGVSLKEQKAAVLKAISEAKKKAPKETEGDHLLANKWVVAREKLDEAEKAARNPHAKEGALKEARAQVKVEEGNVREALAAAINAGQVVEIRIPGDGTYVVKNYQENLAAFEKAVNRKFLTTPVDAKKKMSKPSHAQSKATAPRELEDALLVEGNEWTTDGTVMLRGDLPRKTEERPRTISAQQVQLQLKKYPVKGVPEARVDAFVQVGDDGVTEAISDTPIPKIDGTRATAVRLAVDGNEVYIPQDQYLYIKEHFPDAKFHTKGAPEVALGISSGGKQVGVIMPYAGKGPVGEALLTRLKGVRRPGEVKAEPPPPKEPAKEPPKKEEGGDATAGFTPEPGFKRADSTGAPSASGDKPISRKDIVDLLREKFDIPIRTGRFRAKALGIFKVKPEVIRTRLADDIEVAAHEIGHALQKFLWPHARTPKGGLSSQPFEPFRDELTPIATTPRRGQPTLPEGFAEFIRLYITDPARGKQVAPKFYKHFEETLDERSSEAKEILLQARDGFEKWRTQPDLAKLRAQIVEEKGGGRKTLVGLMEEFNEEFFDEFTPMKYVLLEATGVKRIQDLPADINPYKMMHTLAGWTGKVDAWIKNKPFHFGSLNPIKGVKSYSDILAPIDKAGQRADFDAYLIARRAKDLPFEKTGVVNAPGVFAELEAEFPHFKDAAKDLLAYQKGLLRYMLDAGVLRKWDYFAMLKTMENYTPFYRIMDFDKYAGGVGKGFEVKRSPVKRFKGSTRQFVSPTESILRNTYMFIHAAEKNAVGEALVKLGESEEGLGKYIEEIPPNMEKYPIHDTELESILRKFGQWKTREEFAVGVKSVKESIRDESGADIPAGDRGTRLMRERATEALTARGYTPAEANQIVDRLQNAGTEEVRNKIIERVIEKSIVRNVIKEFEIEIPEGLTFLYRPSPNAPSGNVITVLRDGKPRFYEVDPRIHRTIKRLDSASLGAITKILALPARMLRAGITASPEFFLAKNPGRDQISAYINSKYGYIPGVDFVRGLFHIVRKDNAYWTWKAAGGDHTMLVDISRGALQKTYEEVMREKNATAESIHLITSPLQVAELLSKFTEAATRLGEFAKGLKAEPETREGRIDAAYSSREVTLAFSRRGANATAKTMSILTAFWNANMQDIAKVYDQFKNYPGQTAFRVAVSVTLPSVLLAILNHDNEKIRRIPQWQHDLFWLIDTGPFVARIPKPFNYGILFGSSAERIVTYILNKDPHAFDGFLDSVIEGFSPGYLPTGVTPFFENWANKSTFTGRPIVPGGKEGLLPQYQYAPYTTEAAKKIGELLAISPAKFENALRGLTGTLGTTAFAGVDSILQAAGIVPSRVDPTKTISDYPFIRAFVVRYPASDMASIDRFYKDYEKMNVTLRSAKDLVKRGKLQEGLALLQKEQVANLKVVHQSLSLRKKVVQTVYDSPDIKPEEKRRLIDTAYLQMAKDAEIGNKILDLIRKQKTK